MEAGLYHALAAKVKAGKGTPWYLLGYAERAIWVYVAGIDEPIRAASPTSLTDPVPGPLLSYRELHPI